MTQSEKKPIIEPIKNWLHEGLESLHPYRSSSISANNWLHWLHLLNEPLSDDTTKARRNLLAISTICFVLVTGKLKVSKASAFGLEFSWSDGSFIYTMLYVMSLFFLTTYFITLLGEYVDRSILKRRVFLRSWMDPIEAAAENRHIKSEAIRNVRNNLSNNLTKPEEYKEYLKVRETLGHYEWFENLVYAESEKIWDKYYSKDRSTYGEKIENEILRRQFFVFVKILTIQIFPMIFSIYCLVRMHPITDISLIF